MFQARGTLSLRVFHGREAGGLHGPEVDLAELGQHAVEPAVEGLERGLGPGADPLEPLDVHDLRVGVRLRLRHAAAGPHVPHALDGPLPRASGA